MSLLKKRGFYAPALYGATGTLLMLGASLWSFAAPSKSVAPVKLRYNRDIRPIIAENCFPCHGPDSAARKADLRLDKFAEATLMKNGHAAIVKGKPEQSEMVKRITGHGPLMPPAATRKKLTAQQIALLKRWIAEGAEYETHWSYIPPPRPSPPVVKNAAWARNPIDRFVLAKLEQNGLQPAPEADKRTLARRLSLDLTGLPPSAADVERFLNDKAPNAYEKYVDRLMATPQWGEHRGRAWLDAARYADTHGIHFDNYREMWSYREWVINAFNKNMPFDQFTIEQLAGDLLPKATLEQKVATGFNRCNITSNEGGAISEEYLVLYARDRTETAAQVWLGSTLGCAVCHDHKFDPFSQKDFYSLSAFFNNTTQNAMDGNIKDTPPIIQVPLMEDRPRLETIAGELPEARRKADERKNTSRPDFEKWLGASDAQTVAASIPANGLKFHAPLNEGAGSAVAATFDGKPLNLTLQGKATWDKGQVSEKAYRREGGNTLAAPQVGDFEKDQSFSYAAWVKITDNAGGAIFGRMDEGDGFRGWDMWLEGGKVGTHIIHKYPDDALKVVSREPLPANQWSHVCITYNGKMKPDSVRVYVNGVLKETDTQTDTLKSTIRTTVPFKVGQRNASAGVDGTAIQDIRLYDRALSGSEAAQLANGSRAAYLLSRAGKKITAPETEELFGWWITGKDETYRQLAENVNKLVAEEAAIRNRGTVAHISNEKSEAAMAYVLFRGEYDKRKDPVKPVPPAVLPAMPASYPQNRLGLAKWLLLPNNPLTARVTVNRFWQEVFGTGIVKTTGDFGVTGELPTHPELLDWLAVEFRENGWDIKKLFKLIVSSATYRQAALITPEKRLKDPANRLLSRGARYRMDAEMIRDYALAASGLLVKKIGGPSVKPYQPDGVWEAVAMIGSNTRDYRRDTGESLYRRSMYTFWKRAAPPASMDIFNAPNRETCAVRRERTNTPLQALVTLNDIQFVEAARNLAERALKEGGATNASRINYIANRLLARPFNPTEMAVVGKSLNDIQGFYNGHAKEAKELIMTGESKADASLPAERLAAWTLLTNQLMNLDEALNK